MFLSSSSIGIAAVSWDAYFDLKEALHFLWLFIGAKVLTWNPLKRIYITVKNVKKAYYWVIMSYYAAPMM